MPSAVLLVLALAAIALLLLLVIGLRMSAFMALMTVSVLLAIATRVPLTSIADTMTTGMGNALGSVATVVALGAMLGSLIERADGADTLARRFVRVLGEHRVAIAVTIVAFLVGIPIFFEVAFIVLAPIVFALARVTRTRLLSIALPVGTAALTVHVAVPPHPGPTAAARILGPDRTHAHDRAARLRGRCRRRLPRLAAGPDRRHRSGRHAARRPADGTEEPSDEELMVGADPTGPGTVLFLILAPVIQIVIGTVGRMLVPDPSKADSVLSLVGAPLVALLTAALLACVVLGCQQHWSLDQPGRTVDHALPDVAVVLVAGAGGVFASILVASGAGAALSRALMAVHMPVLLAGFVICLALRASQGSATVAILTTAGLLVDNVAAGGYDALHIALIALAIGFGALGLSHVNDGGFWIFTTCTGLSVQDGLRAWTVLTTVRGLAGFLLTALVWLLA